MQRIVRSVQFADALDSAVATRKDYVAISFLTFGNQGRYVVSRRRIECSLVFASRHSFGMYHDAIIGHGRRCLLESRSKDAYVFIVLMKHVLKAERYMSV